jgi:hypothetical protein
MFRGGDGLGMFKACGFMGKGKIGTFRGTLKSSHCSTDINHRKLDIQIDMVRKSG